MIDILIVDDQYRWLNFHKHAVYEVLGKNANISIASNASEGYNIVLEQVKSPFDVIITDMQMEDDFAPKMAGEWLIEQIQSLPSYYRTKIFIISAAAMIKYIAKKYEVLYIPKGVALNSLEAYKEVLCNNK